MPLSLSVGLELLPTESRLSHLVSEDLDLAVGSVHGLRLVCIQLLVGVRDDVKGKSLYSLLGGELGAEAVDSKDQLGRQDRAKERKEKKSVNG